MFSVVDYKVNFKYELNYSNKVLTSFISLLDELVISFHISHILILHYVQNHLEKGCRKVSNVLK